MKVVILLVLGLFAGMNALADDDFYCMVSVGRGHPIRLQFVFPSGDGDTGRVIYERGRGAISVKRKSERTILRGQGGRPDDIETVWVERTPGGGRYIIEAQGAPIYSFRYVRGTDGRVFRFEPDSDAQADTACTWNRAHR